MKYRSRSDIVDLILEAANDGVTKTKIMYIKHIFFLSLQDFDRRDFSVFEDFL
jgi:predicted transcriptional regulator